MKSEKLWNGNYLRVMTANFCMAFAFYVLTPLLPLYLSEHFSAGKDMIGLVLSGYTLTALLVRLWRRAAAPKASDTTASATT